MISKKGYFTGVYYMPQPTKKQIFDLAFKYYPKSKTAQLFYNSQDLLSERGFCNFIDLLSVMPEYYFESDAEIDFFRAYYEFVKWNLVSDKVFNFLLTKFKEQPIPMKFKRKGVTYEFGTNRKRAFFCNCFSFLPFKFAKCRYFYFKDSSDCQS